MSDGSTEILKAATTKDDFQEAEKQEVVMNLLYILFRTDNSPGAHFSTGLTEIPSSPHGQDYR